VNSGLGSGLLWPKPKVWVGLDPQKEKKKDMLGRHLPNPTLLRAELSPVSWGGLTHIFLFIIIYIIIFEKKTTTKNPKKFKNHFKNFVIFSNIFLPILHNIGLYIYIIKYKSGIKTPDFLQNISKKFKTISKKISKILN
jgi:hypothetical protein